MARQRIAPLLQQEDDAETFVWIAGETSVIFRTCGHVCLRVEGVVMPPIKHVPYCQPCATAAGTTGRQCGSCLLCGPHR